MARSDIPFSTDDAHAFLPWIIGVMAALATLLLCLGLTAGTWVVDRHATYANSFTVNIPAGSDDPPDKTGKIRDALQKMPGVSRVTQVSDDKLRDMLKPWLGGGNADSALPLPVVLDVTMDGAFHPDFSDLQTRLATMVPGVEIDAHEQWIASFSRFSAAMRSLLAMLATLIIGSLALMIAFTSRAELKLHARTVQLLHSIGAEDSYITRQFQQEAFLLTLRGTAPGCLAAGLAYWAAGYYMASMQSSMLPSLAMTSAHVALLVLMPLACGGVAWMAARLSVIKQLQRAL